MQISCRSRDGDVLELGVASRRAVAVLKVHSFRERYTRMQLFIPKLRPYRRHFFFFGTRSGPRYSCIRGGDLGLGFFSSTGLGMEAALDA